MRSLLLTLLLFSLTISAQKPSTIGLHAPKFVRSISLPGATGGFDHLAYDSSSGLLFVAAEDQGTLEVLSLQSGKRVGTVPHFKSPHSIFVLPGSNRILVVDSEKSQSKFLSKTDFKKSEPVDLALGANCILYDSGKKRLYITAGGDRVNMKNSSVVAIDPQTGKELATASIPALHLQPLALDKANNRLFVSIADHNSVGVLDRNNLHLVKEWKLGPEQHHHAPIAFDAGTHRLFLAQDHPGKLIVLNTDTGSRVAKLDIPGDADDMDFDAATHRLFLACGDGYLETIDVSQPNKPRELSRIATGEGAATGMLLVSKREYILAIPAANGKSARIDVFSIR